MAFSDPKTVTLNAIPFDLFRTSVGDNKSVYSTETPELLLKLTASHQYGKRKRSMIRLDVSKIAVNPLVPAQSALVSESITLVVDRPLTGFVIADTKMFMNGLLDLLKAASGADATKFLGGEN